MVVSSNSSHQLGDITECIWSVLQSINDTDAYDILANTSELPHDIQSMIEILSPRESSAWQNVHEGCLDRRAVERPFLLPWWQQLMWTLAFGAMLVVSIGGNSLVMWIVLAHRRMRTVTNYFLMNLSLADLLMSLLNCVFNFIFMLHSDWPFGAVYCTISNFVSGVTIAASVFTLVAISFDRYIAIVRPLHPRMSRKQSLRILFIVWLLSMVLAIPFLLYSKTISVTYLHSKVRRGCILVWPDGTSGNSYTEYIYNVVLFVSTYVIPMVGMLASYSLIARELWGSNVIGEMNDRQAKSIQSKRRLVRMFMVIVILFAVCWLPQQLFFLYQYHNSDVLSADYIQHVYLAIYWLAMANAAINPAIYYWMNLRFRIYFKEVVKQCFKVQTAETSIHMGNMNCCSNNTSRNRSGRSSLRTSGYSGSRSLLLYSLKRHKSSRGHMHNTKPTLVVAAKEHTEIVRLNEDLYYNRHKCMVSPEDKGSLKFVTRYGLCENLPHNARDLLICNEPECPGSSGPEPISCGIVLKTKTSNML